MAIFKIRDNNVEKEQEEVYTFHLEMAHIVTDTLLLVAVRKSDGTRQVIAHVNPNKMTVKTICNIFFEED